MNIIESIHNKRIFLDSFEELRTWASWQAYLKALFGLPMTNTDKKIYKKCTGNRDVPRKESRTSYVLSGRRSGKSKISALIAVYLATYRDWSKVLSPGEQGYIFLIANDKEQAKILKRYISGILARAPGLRQFKKKEITWEIELNNQITIAVRTKNFRTLRGYTVIAAILEELAFWRSEESANPDYEVLAAVEPAMLTVRDSMLIGISSAYAKRGLLYDQYKKYYGKFKGPLIWKSDTLTMNPTANKKKIDYQLKSDPAKYRAEYLSEFRGDIESYLGIEDLERITAKGIRFRAYDSSFRYTAFCDPSGGRVDSMTMAISHIEEDKIILDVILERKPPFSPDDVVKEFSETLKLFKISSVQSDRYAADWVKESFEKQYIRIDYSKLSRSEIYTAFIPIVMNSQAVILDNKRLQTQFANLERHSRAGGKDIIDHAPGSHDDVANSAAGAIIAAQERLSSAGPGRVYYRGQEKAEKMPIMLEDIELVEKARQMIAKHGYAALGAFAYSLSIPEDDLRKRLVALGFYEHKKNRFIYGKDFKLPEKPEPKPEVEKIQEERDGWVVF